jgi:hypothetical protein
MMLSVAVKMQPARDQLLAGAAFALDQDGAVGVGHLVDQIVDDLHFAARADDVVELVFVFELLSQVGVFLPRTLELERALHRHLQLVDLERLRHIAVRSHFHRLDRGIDRGVGSNEDDERLLVIFLNVAQNVEPAHRLHLYVGDNDLRLDRFHLLDRFGGRTKGKDLVSLLTAQRHDHFHHRRLVVYDDDFGHIRRAEIISGMRKGKTNMRIRL